MTTRRILQGGEDSFPSDTGATTSRGKQFGFDGSFSVNSIHCDGSSGFVTNTLWVPPSRGIIFRMCILGLDPGADSNAPSNTGNLTVLSFISNSAGDIGQGLCGVAIPYTDWTSKGGGAGFNYTPGAGTTWFSVNGYGPKGSFVGPSHTSGDYYAGGDFSQGGFVEFFPDSNASPAYDRILVITELTGGQSGYGANLDIFYQFEGSYII